MNYSHFACMFFVFGVVMATCCAGLSPACGNLPLCLIPAARASEVGEAGSTMVSEGKMNILEGGRAVRIDKGFRRGSRAFS